MSYPCPYCHMALTWVPQHQQYYCYFCHRYIPASNAPPMYYPPVYQQQPQQTAHVVYQPTPPPAASQQTAPLHVTAQKPVPPPTQPPAYQTAPPAQPSTPKPAAEPEHGIPEPAKETVKPAVEYSAQGPAHQAEAPVAHDSQATRPTIYLCKACGTKLEVAFQRWYCPRCQQYK